MSSHKQKMTSVLPVHLVLFRVFLRKSDKNRLKSKKPHFLSRNKALKCRGGEIRTPDLLLPKEEVSGLYFYIKISVGLSIN